MNISIFDAISRINREVAEEKGTFLHSLQQYRRWDMRAWNELLLQMAVYVNFHDKNPVNLQSKKTMEHIFRILHTTDNLLYYHFNPCDLYKIKNYDEIYLDLDIIKQSISDIYEDLFKLNLS